METTTRSHQPSQTCASFACLRRFRELSTKSVDHLPSTEIIWLMFSVSAEKLRRSVRKGATRDRAAYHVSFFIRLAWRPTVRFSSNTSLLRRVLTKG